MFESVPPKLYGGTERVVSWLTEELVHMGHEVTLYASGDSVTGARLVSPCARALRLADPHADPTVPHLVALELLARDWAKFDIIHYHLDCLHFPMSRRLNVPHVTTLHGRLDRPELGPLFQEFDDEPVVSISSAHPGLDRVRDGRSYFSSPVSLLVMTQPSTPSMLGERIFKSAST